MLTARRLTTSHIWGPKHHEATGEGRRLWRQTSLLRRFWFFLCVSFPTDQHAVRASGGQGALFSLSIRIRDSEIIGYMYWKTRGTGCKLDSRCAL